MDHHDLIFEISQSEYDALIRACFTKWLEQLLSWTRQKYIRTLKRQLDTVSLDHLLENGFHPVTPSPEQLFSSNEAFLFEEQRLALAYQEIPLKRRKILEMLFIQQLSPELIAEKLNCTVQHVYNQRSKALRHLRQNLKEGEPHE